MGSRRFAGVWFAAFSLDHPPPHVHAAYGGVTAILDLLPEGGVDLADRTNPYFPANAKRSNIRRIIRIARENEAALRTLWETVHG